jgi:phosphoribosyl-ATP pyrophosphohydrolase/phosphoribosyl-AMP cyclohydrolase
LINDLKIDAHGLIPAIAQDDDTGEVLMLGYMNEEALRRTLSSGEVWFYSRSRQELWHKGETSGNYIKVHSVWKDCDGDTILVKGKATGPVCHTGNKTCFFQQLNPLDSHQEEA